MAADEKLNLRQWRIAVGLEAYDLAKMAGVSLEFVRQGEHPYGQALSRIKLQKVFDVLSAEYGKTIRIEDCKDLKVI